LDGVGGLSAIHGHFAAQSVFRQNLPS
jgi:hypothetical protein